MRPTPDTERGSPPATCLFCERVELDSTLVASSDHSVIFEDAFPVSPGHLLVVGRRHVSRLRDLTSDEIRDLWEMVTAARIWLERSHHPDGYNIGLNDGAAAGQTISHLHLHVIPRYAGDVEDPRGGIRWVVPDRAPYWERDV